MPFAPQHFADRLTSAIIQKQTPLLVGIDPRLNQLPASLRVESKNLQAAASSFATFGKCVIDAVKDLVPAVKPQAAFYEQLGPAGMQALDEVVAYAHDSNLIVIMDAKRGDIGSTAQAYAAAYLGPRPETAWGCDSLTVNPYMGNDTLEPFYQTAQENGAGIFVLCKTSNPGSDFLQSCHVEMNGETIYNMVADEIQRLCESSMGDSNYGIVGAVVGATYPQQLAELRNRAPNSILLVPGFGAQGGTAADVAPALDNHGTGALINSSRGVIFAYEKPEYATIAKSDWQHAVRQSAIDTIELLADQTNAGKLRSD